MANLPPIVVLCGGLGTRLREVIPDRPKALADVGGVPFLDVLLDGLARQGAHRVILAAGYLGEQVRAHVEASTPGLVEVVEEPSPLGTAGALRFAQVEANLTGPFLAMNGDTLFTGSLSTLVREHKSRGLALTLALVPPPGGNRFGRVALDHSSRVVAFEEKTDRPGGWTNAGVYMIEPDALGGVEPGCPASLEREILPGLIPSGIAGLMYPDATFLDIGTPESLADAASFLDSHPPL